MLGLVAAQPVSPRVLLRDAPRSLSELSREHRDGWGVASWNGEEWHLEKSTLCAAVCLRYAQVADHAPANLLIAHVRQKTVGETALDNTHPFRRSIAGCDMVFAHNGTVRDVPELMKQVSEARAAEIVGDTDSERLFAFIATAIDDAEDVERGVQKAVRQLQALHRTSDVGSITFLLSCGEKLYAHRLGRTLHLLQRGIEVNTRRTAAVVLASERLTDEPWVEVAEGALLKVERDADATPTFTHLL